MKRTILLTALIPTLLFGQRDFSAMHVSHTKLAPDIHRLFVGDIVTVVAFTGDDGILLIDAAYEQTTPQLLDTLRNISEKPVRYLVNTHLHGDHTGGNLEFGKNADIIAHHSVKQWLESDRRQGGRAPGPYPAHAIPNITFEGNMHLEFNGELIKMYHLPQGHTAGDVIVWFSESNILVLGDLLFAEYFPFIDISQGGNPLGYMRNLHYILEQFPEDAIVVGGHGPVYTMPRLRKWLNNLEESMKVVAEYKQNGFTPEEMKDLLILATWESYGEFFITTDRWIDTVYPYVD